MAKFTGSFVNALLVVIGTFVGLGFKKILKEKTQESVTNALGLVVIYIALTTMLQDNISILNVLISLAIGTFIGESVDLQKRVEKLGDYLASKIKSKSNISTGFVEATLLFCVGSMAIVGSIESGIQNNHTTLIAKGIIDGITSIFFAAKNGIGVAFSAIALFIYQGGVTLASSFIAPLLNEVCIAHISTVGGIILLSVALNMLKIGKFKPMNYIPAIIISAILSYLI